MKLLIEEHDYPVESVNKLFPNIDELDPIDGMVRVNYVGYYYHAAEGESVFHNFRRWCLTLPTAGSSVVTSRKR